MIRAEITQDCAANLYDELHNLLFAIDKEEMSMALVQLLSAGYYEEVVQIVKRIRELRVKQAERAITFLIAKCL